MKGQLLMFVLLFDLQISFGSGNKQSWQLLFKIVTAVSGKIKDNETCSPSFFINHNDEFHFAAFVIAIFHCFLLF